jgi:UDP-N-acetylglucosamine 1-carboxyvinyltransferase
MPDLRGGFAFIVASMLADGTSRLYGVEHIARGYAEFLEKARLLGAQINPGRDVAADQPVVRKA